MTNSPNPFGRSDLNMELRVLLAADRGIEDAGALLPRLPLLREHPAVVSQTPKTSGRSFQREVKRLLAKAIVLSGESEAMQEAVRWHLVLDKGDVIEALEDRKKKAAEKAGLSLNRYCKDRKGYPLPALTVTLEAVELALDQLGRGDPSRPTLKIGEVAVPDIIPIAACRQGQDLTHSLALEFESLPDERPACAEWSLISGTVLLDLISEGKAAKHDFEDEKILDLVCAKELDAMPDGRRHYQLGIAPADYYTWAATANVLDRDLSHYPTLTGQLENTTLRQAWAHGPTRLEDLEGLPAPCFIGVCVVVVVEDEIIVLERQRMHHVAGAGPMTAATKRPVHFVGEGVTPDDCGHEASPPDHTALRGCKEELHLEPADIELIPTALIFDTKRWQPLFCYLARYRLTLPALEARMTEAEDLRETGFGHIAARIPWTITDSQTQALLTNSDPSMRLASNHAQVALLYALAYAEGLERIATETTQSNND